MSLREKIDMGVYSFFPIYHKVYFFLPCLQVHLCVIEVFILTTGNMIDIFITL